MLHPQVCETSCSPRFLNNIRIVDLFPFLVLLCMIISPQGAASDALYFGNVSMIKLEFSLVSRDAADTGAVSEVDQPLRCFFYLSPRLSLTCVAVYNNSSLFLLASCFV